MPTAPPRRCRCGALVSGGSCATCRGVTDARRGSAASRGYDSRRWRPFAKAWLRRYPLCGMRADGTLDTVNSRCAREGRTTAAQCVDHTLPISKGGALFDPANLMSACIRCNSEKGDRMPENRKTISADVATG